MTTNMPVLSHPSPLWTLLLLLSVSCSTTCPAPCECKWQQGLSTLDCAEKNITKVPFSSDEMQAVILDRNNMNQLEAFEFFNADWAHVRKISLKFCQLDSFKEDLFSGLTNLHHLDLSHNSLVFLSSNQFPSLPQLRTLDLSHNSLASIHKDSFSHLGVNLFQIDLSGNSLTSIPWTTFLYLPSLRQLVLADNPWHCDCKLGSLHSELSTKNIFPDEASCSTPERLSTKTWSTLPRSEFTCPPTVSLPHSHQQVVLPGQDLPLQCQVTGNPTPLVEWRKDGHTILKRSNEHNISVNNLDEGSIDVLSILTIKNMSSSSPGLYSCLAKNAEGVDEKELKVSLLVADNSVAKSDDQPVVLLIAISATTTVILIMLLMLVTVYCCRKFNVLKTESHSSNFTFLQNGDKEPSWPNTVLNPPRTGAYDQISCTDISGTLSRSSTRQTYLLAEACDEDTSHLSGDQDASLPRTHSEWSGKENFETSMLCDDNLGLVCNMARSRSSIDTLPNMARSRSSMGTLSNTFDPIYGTIRHHHSNLTSVHQANSHHRPAQGMSRYQGDQSKDQPS